MASHTWKPAWHLQASRKVVLREAAFKPNIAQIGGQIYNGPPIQFLQSDSNYTDPLHIRKGPLLWASKDILASDCSFHSVQSFVPGIFTSGLDGSLTSIVCQLLAWPGRFLVHLPSDLSPRKVILT